MRRFYLAAVWAALFVVQVVPALAADEPDALSGKRLYSSYCVFCHGQNGAGGGALTKKLKLTDKIADLTESQYSEAEVADLVHIISGYDRDDSRMPKWGVALSKAELRDISAYVKTLGTRFAVVQGKRIYSSLCSSCHGADGKGQGGLARTLKITNRLPDLTSDKYKNIPVEALKKAVIAYGVNEPMLPRWDEVVTDSQLVNVLKFIRRFGQSDLHFYGDASRGRQIFIQHCAACHGHKGKGDGVLAKLIGAKMVDYSSKSQLEIPDDRLIHVISMGFGTYMPRWYGRLTNDEIRDVAAYVRTLYRKP